MDAFVIRSKIFVALGQKWKTTTTPTPRSNNRSKNIPNNISNNIPNNNMAEAPFFVGPLAGPPCPDHPRYYCWVYYWTYCWTYYWTYYLNPVYLNPVYLNPVYLCSRLSFLQKQLQQTCFSKMQKTPSTLRRQTCTQSSACGCPIHPLSIRFIPLPRNNQ